MAKARKTYTARDPAALAKTLVLWLHLLVAASAVGLIADLYTFGALSRLSPNTPIGFTQTPPGMETPELVSGLASLPLLVIWVVSGILTLKWIYRVTMNSHTLADGVRNSPPWSIGWFFVPFANLYKPFQSVADAWTISLDPHGWRTADIPNLLRWWWGLWLFVSSLDNASFRLELRADSVAEASLAAGLDIVSDLAWIPLCLTLIRIVRRLSAQQSSTLGVAAFS